VAVANGKDAEQLVKDTVARMLENQARFIAGVQRGIEQADRGEFVEHQEVLRAEPEMLYPAMVVSHPNDRKKSQGWGTELRGTAIMVPL
jgi:hypothetical protein